METPEPATSGAPSDRPTGWRYLELRYDTDDRAPVLVDGVPVSDGRTAAGVIADLGAAGWEMVDSAGATGTAHLLWFRRPLDPPPDAPASDARVVTVVLVKIGDARYDPERHARLVASIRELTGQSGWRATRIVDKAPRVVAADVSTQEAERIRTTLEGLGATVEVG